MGASLVMTLALGAVVVVLLAGLFNMLRGGDSNLSQTLMRWRVALQLVAVVVVLGVLWLRS